MLLLTIKSEERKHQGFRFRDGPYQSCTGRCAQQMTVVAEEATESAYSTTTSLFITKVLYYHHDFVPWVPFHAHRLVSGRACGNDKNTRAQQSPTLPNKRNNIRVHTIVSFSE